MDMFPRENAFILRYQIFKALSPWINWTRIFTWLTTFSYPGTLQVGICKATIPVTKEKYVTSQWKQVGEITWFSRNFEFFRIYVQYAVAYLCRDWSRLVGSNASNILEIVVWRGRPLICVPGTSLYRTINHSGVVVAGNSCPTVVKL